MEYFGKNPPIVVWKKLLLEDFYYERGYECKSIRCQRQILSRAKGFDSKPTCRDGRCFTFPYQKYRECLSQCQRKVLVQIANALEVPIDVLLCDSLKDSTNRMARVMEYNHLLSDCNDAERKIIMGTVRELKKQLRDVRENGGM